MGNNDSVDDHMNNYENSRKIDVQAAEKFMRIFKASVVESVNSTLFPIESSNKARKFSQSLTFLNLPNLTMTQFINSPSDY